METTELRIGNLVSIFDIVYEVRGMLSYGIYSKKLMCDNAQEDFEHIKNIQPIPLTSHWLLKLGFHKSKNPNGDDCYHILNDDGFSVDFTVEHWTNPDINIKYHNHFHIFAVRRKIKYVHELQNLYFWKEGKELTLTTA